jgi:hypothetical protein
MIFRGAILTNTAILLLFAFCVGVGPSAKVEQKLGSIALGTTRAADVQRRYGPFHTQASSPITVLSVEPGNACLLEVVISSMSHIVQTATLRQTGKEPDKNCLGIRTGAGIHLGASPEEVRRAYGSALVEGSDPKGFFKRWDDAGHHCDKRSPDDTVIVRDCIISGPIRNLEGRPTQRGFSLEWV